jgi:hypothetical protein
MTAGAPPGAPGPMRRVDVKDKVAELLPHPPDWDRFLRLGNLTKLRVRPDGSFYRANFESGVLLYALVRRFRPRVILDIGTGRGFSALSTAMALCDGGIDGRVVTVDVRGYDEEQEWPIDLGHGPRVARLSLREVWEGHVEPSLIERVERRQGSSEAVLGALIAGGHLRAGLVYIDADHSWRGVRHDYLASLMLVDVPFRMLLDDYHPGSDLYGVRRLVDGEIARDFEPEAIFTDRRWCGEERAGIPLQQADYAQVLVDSEHSRAPLARLLERRRLARALGRHRRLARLARLGQRLAQRVRTAGRQGRPAKASP